MRRPNDAYTRRSLLKTGRLSDLTLIIPELHQDSSVCSPEKFRIHSSIVASRCPTIWGSLGASVDSFKSSQFLNKEDGTWTWQLNLPSAIAIDGPWTRNDIDLFLEHVYLEASNDTWEAYWSGLPDITDDIMLRCWLRQHRLAHYFQYQEMVEAIEFYIGSIMLDRWAKQEHNHHRLKPYITFLLEACLEVPEERNTIFLRVLAWALSILPSLERLNQERLAIRAHWRAFATKTLHVSESTMAGLAHDATCFVICPKCLETPLIMSSATAAAAAAGGDTCCPRLSSPPLARKKYGRPVIKTKKKKLLTTTTTTTTQPFALSGAANQPYPTTLVYMNMTPFSKSETIPVTYEYLDAHYGLMYQELSFKSNDYFPSIPLSFKSNTPRLHHGRCMHCQQTQPVHAIFTRQMVDNTTYAA